MRYCSQVQRCYVSMMSCRQYLAQNLSGARRFEPLAVSSTPTSTKGPTWRRMSLFGAFRSIVLPKTCFVRKSVCMSFVLVAVSIKYPCSPFNLASSLIKNSTIVRVRVLSACCIGESQSEHIPNRGNALLTSTSIGRTFSILSRISKQG